MTQFFQNYFHFALEATIVILIVLAIRPLIRRFSKRIASLLWIVVFFRLLCPFTIEGPVPAFWNQWTEDAQHAAVRDERLLADSGLDVAEQSTGQQGGLDNDGIVQDENVWDVVGQGDVGADVTGQGVVGLDGDEVDVTGRDAANQDGNGVDLTGWDGNEAEVTSRDAESQDGNEPGVTGYDIASQGDNGEEMPSQDLASQDENGMDVTGQDGVPDVAGKGTVSSEGTLETRQVLDEWLATEELEAKAPEKGFSLGKAFAALNAWFQSVSGKCFINVCGVIWAFVAMLNLTYGFLRYVRLSRKLGEAIPAGEWKKYPVKSSDVSGVPMSFGILRPGIYVPASFREDSSKKIDAKEREMVLLHEATHLNRRDPLWKLLSLLALCVHWWNPFAWLCIRLFHQDVEMACDEGVLARIGQDKKKEYANALLHFAQRQSGLSLSAAFGESNAESRIKEVLKFKKNPIWLSVLLVGLVVLLGGCLATKPRAEGKGSTSGTEDAISEETPSSQPELDVQVSDAQKLYDAESVAEDGHYVYDSNDALQVDFREHYPDEYPVMSEMTEEEWLAGMRKAEEYLQTATAAQLRRVTTKLAISADPYWEGGNEGDFVILDVVPRNDATLYGLYGDGGMVLRVGEKTYPIWLSWASLYHGPILCAGDYDGDGEEEYALVVITGTGTGVYKEGLYVIELRENEAEVHEFTECVRHEELAKRLTCEYNKNEKRLTLAIDKDNPDAMSYVGLFLEGHLPEDQADSWLAGSVRLGFGDQERMQPVDDDLFYELSGGLLFSAEGAPACPQYDVSVNLTCRVQYHADGSFTIGKIRGEAEYYDELSREDNVPDVSRGEEVILEQYADLTRDGVKDVIVTSVTYHEENKNLSWKERMGQYEGCIVRVYNGADPQNAIWEKELADAHAVNGMILLCKKDGREYLLTGSMSMYQGILDPEYRVFSLGESGTEYEVDAGRTSASVTAPEDVWDMEAMVSYTKKLDAWTKDATLLALTDVDFDDRIGGRFDASESWKYLYSSVQEFKDAIEYGEGQLESNIPDVIPLRGMSNFEESLNSLHACWKKCAEWIAYEDNMHRILTDLQPGKNIYTCHLTHDAAPLTVAVDYKDAVNHVSDKVLIEIKNLAEETIWNTAVPVGKDVWECYYLTIYEEQAYMIRYVPVHEVDGVSEGYFKMFYLNEGGEEQVICECSVNSKDSKDFEKDKAAFEETKDEHMGKMNLIIGVADGQIAVKQVRE